MTTDYLSYLGIVDGRFLLPAVECCGEGGGAHRLFAYQHDGRDREGGCEGEGTVRVTCC